jgi:catechol 2,3-dioxygenase-like lactoylglutathione lyase family enzyme
MKETLSVDKLEAQLDWYRDRLGWLCRPHEDGGAAADPGRREAVELDLVLGGSRRTGALDLPALIGVAALERIGRRPAAAGPVLDGLGRLCFLVDLGEIAALDTGPVEFWHGAGVDVRLLRRGALALPTPGRCGPKAMVWAVPPGPEPTALPPVELLLGFLDRAVRDACPSLWELTRRSSPSKI